MLFVIIIDYKYTFLILSYLTKKNFNMGINNCVVYHCINQSDHFYPNHNFKIKYTYNKPHHFCIEVYYCNGSKWC